MFCFTPKGDLIALPRGATPIDFAYAVHSQVGDRCVGAKIDGRMVQLRAQLQNGDQVEIITSKSGTPSPEWERFVVTGKARARIRRYLRLRQREEHLAHGRELLAKAGAPGAGERHRQAARAACSSRCARSRSRICWPRSSDGAIAPRDRAGGGASRAQAVGAAQGRARLPA